MRATSLIILSLGCLFAAGNVAAAPAAGGDAVTVNIHSEGQHGFCADLNFPTPNLRAVRLGGYPRLWVEMEGMLLDFDAEGPALPSITRLIAVPDGYRVQAKIRQIQIKKINVEAVLPRDEQDDRALRQVQPLPMVDVGETGRMRWLNIAPVAIRPVAYNAAENTLEAVENLSFEFEFVPDPRIASHNNSDPARYWSPIYDELFRAMLLNPNYLPFIMPGGTIVRRGSYVIITNHYLTQTLTDFVEWKKRKGYNVVVAPIYRPGIAPEEIRDWIKNAYDTWTQPPEVVLLLGDVNAAAMQMPAFRMRHPDHRRYPNENDVTDLPYTLMNPEDYFPDLLIGRVSVDSSSPTDPLKYWSRILAHEQDAHTFPAAAFHRATLYGGNFGDGALPVLSPVETCEWLGMRLEARGWNVEGFYYRGEGDNINPDPIIRSLNRSVNIFVYRGWADANGTHFPQFYRNHLPNVDNGPLLPIWTFFVCNVGDFGNNAVNPCFGEMTILNGTRRRPSGALAFFGPSDLHTNTRFNNPLLGGFYSTLLFKDVRALGALTLAGKFEIWRNNPDYRYRSLEGNWVEFYFHVYNILGDPDVAYYLDPPQLLQVEHNDTFYTGQTNGRFVVRNGAGRLVKGALLTLRKGDQTNLSILTDDVGVALAPLQLLTPDTLQITAIAHNASPYKATVPVLSPQTALVDIESITVLNQNGGAELLTGQSVDIQVTLRNYGSQPAMAVTASLNLPNDDVYEVIERNINFGNIAANASVQSPTALRVQMNSFIWFGTRVIFHLNIYNDGVFHNLALFRLPVAGPQLTYLEHRFDGLLAAGQTRAMVVRLTNQGGQVIEGLYGLLHTHDNSIIVETDRAEFGAADVGDTVECAQQSFRLTARQGVTPGRVVMMRMELFNRQNQQVGRVFFNITVGERRPTNPMGPDAYGYYAYDNTDIGYDQTPVYNWLELDPEQHGAYDQMFKLKDDTTVGFRLPFRFRYYGVDYDSIFVCSNGWLSFAVKKIGNEWDFFNYPLPCPLGPATMIAPFWEDLVGRSLGSNVRDSIKVFTRYDRNEGRLIIEWSQAYARGGGNIEALENFEVILLDPAIHRSRTGDGDFIFQYNSVALVDRSLDYTFATVGFQDFNHQRGMELTYASYYQPGCDSLVPGRAIKFTTNPPDEFLATHIINPTAPSLFRLEEPYPNPFNAQLTVDFELPASGYAHLALFDLSGRLAMEIAKGEIRAGKHTAALDAMYLPNGLYLLRLETGQAYLQRKVILLK